MVHNVDAMHGSVTTRKGVCIWLSPTVCMELLMHMWDSLLIFFIFLKLISWMLLFILSLSYSTLIMFFLIYVLLTSSLIVLFSLLLCPFHPFVSLTLIPTFPPCSRKVTRSESARVDRHSSRRHGSSRAKQSRSRSDVDLQPPAPTSTPALFHPQLLHP